MKSTNTVWHNATVTRGRRERLNKHRGAAIWYTGLSGSGKSTLAHTVEEALHQMGFQTFFHARIVPRTFAASARWCAFSSMPA
jgi:adenylylsulfate kinase